MELRHSVTSCVSWWPSVNPSSWADGWRIELLWQWAGPSLGKQTTFPQEEDPERNSVFVWPAYPLPFLINSQNSPVRKLLLCFLAGVCVARVEDSGIVPPLTQESWGLPHPGNLGRGGEGVSLGSSLCRGQHSFISRPSPQPGAGPAFQEQKGLFGFQLEPPGGGWYPAIHPPRGNGPGWGKDTMAPCECVLYHLRRGGCGSLLQRWVR